MMGTFRLLELFHAFGHQKKESNMHRYDQRKGKLPMECVRDKTEMRGFFFFGGGGGGVCVLCGGGG